MNIKHAVQKKNKKNEAIYGTSSIKYKASHSLSLFIIYILDILLLLFGYIVQKMFGLDPKTKKQHLLCVGSQTVNNETCCNFLSYNEVVVVRVSVINRLTYNFL